MKLLAQTLFVFLALLGFSSAAWADVPVVYSNDTFLTAQHDLPISFTQDASGNFTGVTTTGKLFSQNIITNSLDIRLQRFAIDEAFFYVSDRGVIFADSDTVALSIYLTRTG
jgi:hypothetical protein